MEVQVRAECDADAGTIAALHEHAFGEQAEARLVDEIRRSDRFVPELALVAESGGTVVGHLLLSYVDLVGEQKRHVLALAPMGVEPRVQRRGVGAFLVEAAVDRANRLEEPLIVVLGHPSYYPRFGFERAHPLGILPPVDVPDEAWMVRRLHGYDPTYAGRIVYPPAFDVVQ